LKFFNLITSTENCTDFFISGENTNFEEKNSRNISYFHLLVSLKQKNKDVPRDIDIISCSEDDTNINYDSDKDPEYVPDNNASVLTNVENVSLVSDIVSNCQNCKNKLNYNLIL